jgi:amino acid transporter, AAT family
MRLNGITGPDCGEPTFAAISDRETGLRRTLSARQLAMIAIGGAIGTGLFLGSGSAIGLAGPSVLISYLVGAFITLLLMGCLAEMTVAHPTSGSFGAWAEFYVSPLAGFLVRYAYWAGVVLAVGTEISAVAIYMRFWFPAVPGWKWMALFSLALVSLNTFNVRFFGALESLLSGLKIVAILAFLCLGIWVVLTTANKSAGGTIGLRNYMAFGGFFPRGWGGTWTAVLVSLFSYFSIEMIAVAAGEAKDPRQAIMHAFRATMMRLVLFYVLTLALMLLIVPWTAISSGATESPFVIVMRRTHIPAAAGLINFVILVAALSAMNSQLYITTRIMFSISRGGFAPAILGRLTLQGVPVPALIASTGGIALATLLNLRYHERAFLLMLAISMFGPLFTWFMIFVTHLLFRKRHQQESLSFRMWGYPYTSLLGAALMLAALITTLFQADFRPTLLYGVPFLILLSVAFGIIRPKAAHSNQATQIENLPI